MQIKPKDQEEPKILICPFCGANWEFIVNESYKEAKLTFQCLGCNKRITIEKL